MAKLYNLARMTSSTTGTGTITLGSAVSGYLTFALAGAASGDVVDYAIKDGANSEIGTGTYTVAAGPVYTLTRTVTKSTNSNAAISLSGAAEVFISPRAETLDIEFNRRNSLLDLIYQSKSFAEYRRGVNVFATGFKGASDALNGINTGSSSNYTVTPGTAGATTGNVAPTLGAGTTVQISPNSGSTALGDFTYFDRTTALVNSVVVSKIGVYSTSAHTVSVKIGKQNTTTNFDVVYTETVSHPGGGWVDFTLASPYTVPGTGTYNLGAYYNGTSDTTASVARSVVAGNQGVATGVTMIAATNVTIPMRYVHTVLPADMTLVTTSQTADSSVSNGRVLIEYDNTATPSLNIDLTVEVQCDGSTWTMTTLSSVTSYSQSGRKVAETADTACTSGTSFAARIKTVNNKNVPIYGAAILVE